MASNDEVFSDNRKEWIYKVSQNNQECQLETVSTLSVKGRLKRHVEFWRNIWALDFDISVIEKGYKIPFIEVPPVAYLRNNKSALQHDNFAQQAISELLQSNRIVETITTPYVVNPLSVSVQPSGKLRLILDLRHVNNYVQKQKMNMKIGKLH